MGKEEPTYATSTDLAERVRRRDLSPVVFTFGRLEWRAQRHLRRSLTSGQQVFSSWALVALAGALS